MTLTRSDVLDFSRAFRFQPKIVITAVATHSTREPAFDFSVQPRKQAQEHQGPQRSTIYKTLIQSTAAQQFDMSGIVHRLARQTPVADWRLHSPLSKRPAQPTGESVLSFSTVAELLKDVLPVDAGLPHETARQHVMATADRLEWELGPEQFVYDAKCRLISASAE